MPNSTDSLVPSDESGSYGDKSSQICLLRVLRSLQRAEAKNDDLLLKQQASRP